MKIFSFFVAMVVGAAGAAEAQTSQISKCDAALSQAVLVYNSYDTYDWRLATLVTQDQWATQKASAGASAVIYGVPIGGSYDEYKNNVQKFYSQHNESISITQSRAIAWRGLEDTNVTAYAACLDTLKKSSPGLYLFVEKLTDTTATLSLYYNAGGADRNSIAIKLVDQLNHVPASAPRRLVKGTTVQFTVARPLAGDSTFTVNAVSGAVNADSVVIPALPKKLPAIWTLSMSVDDEMSCQINGNPTGSASIKAPVTDKDVTFAIRKVGNTLTCQPRDVYKAYGRYPCWAYNVELRRDGNLIYNSNERQCYEGAKDQPGPVSYSFDDAAPLDLRAVKQSLGILKS